jgi:S-(hydroxymethyl)glutathione dehydrogenase/alcohol dehydrogenase
VRIRAAVLEQFGAPLEVQEIELEEPRAGEALVRLVACGVCHTDLYTASGADPSGYAPTVLGHEGAGVVERVGAGVEVLASVDGTPVLVRQGSALAAAFHPELSDDDRIHRMFLEGI